MSPDRRLLLETPRFCIEEIDLGCEGEPTVRKAVVRHPGAVTILPILDDGRICLIRNRRAAVGHTLVELPAGTREPNETAEETARRELVEETGFSAADWCLLREFYMSPGIMDERMSLFVARQLSFVGFNREVGEDIENFVVSLTEAMVMVDTGRIQDAKSLVGLMHYARGVRAANP